MTNPIFGYPTATDYFVLGGGSYNALYPRDNMKNDDLDMVARTIDDNAPNTTVYGTAPTPVSIGLIGVFNINWSMDSTVRLRMWSDAAMATAPLMDETMPVFPNGRYCDTHWIYLCDENFLIQAFRVDVIDSANIEGFIDFGRLEVAHARECGFGMIRGSQRGRLLRTGSAQTPGGMKFFRELDSARTMKLSFDAEEDEMIDFYQEMLRIYDLHTPFVLIPHPDDLIHSNQTSMLCRFTATSPAITLIESFRSQISFEVEQVL